jgi:hypothetical protein
MHIKFQSENMKGISHLGNTAADVNIKLKINLKGVG